MTRTVVRSKTVSPQQKRRNDQNASWERTELRGEVGISLGRAVLFLLGLLCVELGPIGENFLRGSAWGASPHEARGRVARPASPPTRTPTKSQLRVPSRFTQLTQGYSVFDEPYEMSAPPSRSAPRTVEMVPQGEVIPEGTESEYFDHLPYFGNTTADHHLHGSCEDACCGHLLSRICWDAWEGFAGVQGFAGPLNRGSTGSFGFHQGMNWGTPLPLLFGDAVAGQLGVRAVQSNFRGAEFTSDERRQVFVTGGLFRRVDWGLQGGVVLDYLHESWYLDADFVQIRGELSWVFPGHHELGFWFTSSNQTETVVSSFATGASDLPRTETYAATDLHAFFYRFRADDCGGLTGRIFAGFTGQSDGLLGADWTLPLRDTWALRSNFTYLIPQEGRGAGGHMEDSWNVGLSLVWRPGGGFARHQYFRPLLEVASNGTFFVDRQ